MHSPQVQGALPLCGPSLSFPVCWSGAPCVSSGVLDSSCDPPGRCRPSRISRKSLVRSWKPVCSLVGGAISGAEFVPFPSPVPRSSGGEWAGPKQLYLLWDHSALRSGNQWVVPKFRAFPNLILSLLLSHSLSCYLTLAPSDCPQSIQARSLP